MKKKYLGLLILIVTTMMPIGCSKVSSENVLLGSEKIIIAENTDKKKNENFEVQMVKEIEPLDPETIYSRLSVKENIIQLIYEYPSNVISEVRVGEVDTNNNVNWITKNVEGEIYENFTYNGLYPNKIKKDNKVYIVNEDGDLEELTVYTELIQEQGKVPDYHYTYRNGTIDEAIFISNEEQKLAVVDILNEKYYVIPDELIRNDKDGALSAILAINGDRIYVSYVYVDADLLRSLSGEVKKGENVDISKDIKITIGYIENNKFTKILSEDDGIKIDNAGEMIYENGRILFSGLAEGENGIWNYDVDNKKFTKIVDVDSGTLFEFHINENKDKVIISSLKRDLQTNEIQKSNLSIANINDKLEISNITNLFTSIDENYSKRFSGWANGGETFYLNATTIDENYYETSKLEVYNIVE